LRFLRIKVSAFQVIYVLRFKGSSKNLLRIKVLKLKESRFQVLKVFRFEVLRFQGFEVSKNQGFKVSRHQGFRDMRFLGFMESNV
jgi:hypothetical protein